MITRKEQYVNFLHEVSKLEYLPTKLMFYEVLMLGNLGVLTLDQYQYYSLKICTETENKLLSSIFKFYEIPFHEYD